MIPQVVRMADEIRELMNKKDKIENEIREYLDVLQSVGLMYRFSYASPRLYSGINSLIHSVSFANHASTHFVLSDYLCHHHHSHHPSVHSKVNLLLQQIFPTLILLHYSAFRITGPDRTYHHHDHHHHHHHHKRTD